MTMTTDFKVSFGGDSHELDLTTLTTSLVNFGFLIQEIQQQIAPESKVDIKVRPPERGSFSIDLVLNVPDATILSLGLFTEGVTLVENLLSIFTNFIGLKKHLNGEPPKSIAPNNDGLTLNIENNSGNIYIINQPAFELLDKVPKLDKLITAAFDVIEKDNSVENVQIIDYKNEVLANVESAEFETMSKPVQTREPKERRAIVKSGVDIRAYRLSFEENTKWGFVYDGQKISAPISDPTFLKAIEEQESFAKGDVFKVDLSIMQEYDSLVRDYLNTGYEVIKVIEHIRSDNTKQGNLFEDMG